MNKELIHKLQYSHAGQHEANLLPSPLIDSLQLISDFFSNKINNKLCLVFPSKEYTAQWLSIPLVLFLIESDFTQFNVEITETYKQFRQKDKLILNGKAIVEWVGIKPEGVAFKTKGVGDSSGAEISIAFSDVIKLQKVGVTRKLSSLKTVKEVLPKRNITPTEDLLKIDTYGNKEFMKNKICLVSKFKSYDDSIENIKINFNLLQEYFRAGKINENGVVETNSPLLISNNLSTLALYISQSSRFISKIIIDGFSMIQERGTDFSDIDVNDIPTILITDLSEIQSFDTIGNYGFEFFNLTKEHLRLDYSDYSSNISPFHSFDKKLKNYCAFNVIKEICQDIELETVVKKIHSIEKDESNSDLTALKISMIQLTNLISRITHIPTFEEITNLNSKISSIETLFIQCRMWLGISYHQIEESIAIFKSLITRLATQPPEKCERLKMLIKSKQYDYIICATEEEASALADSLSVFIERPRVISVADVNNKLLFHNTQKAILTGWVKSININKILSSFLFSELTILFYEFEDKYYNSLQRRNKQYSENIKTTIDCKGIRFEPDSSKRFSFVDLYNDNEIIETRPESSLDILDFEISIDNKQYLKYAAKGNLIESIRAKRIVFDRDFFIYTTESHKFLVINELIEKKSDKANLYRKKVEFLQTGDMIALINTDRDILVELVEKNTNKKKLASVKRWTDLWKNLLREYYTSTGSDFKKLVEDLRKNNCKKHEVTIRAWLQDDSRIGPEDNADLISIALVTNSNLLYDNILTVREAIKKMTGWRMKASDFITDKIKAQIHEFADNTIINAKIPIEGLGSLNILKIIEISNKWDNIDIRYVNKLLQKEII